VIDPLPDLQKGLREGGQTYFLSADGHPNAFGQHLIARAVQEHLDVSGIDTTSLRPGHEDIGIERQVMRLFTPAHSTRSAEACTVTVRLKQMTPLPSVAEIRPYERALVVHAYQVEQTLSGVPPGEDILIAHWAVVDLEPVLRDWQTNAVYQFDLEPFDAHTDLANDMMVINTDRVDLPLYLERRAFGQASD